MIRMFLIAALLFASSVFGAIVGTLSGEIVYQNNLGNGQIEVLFRYTDHQSKTYDVGPKRVAEGTNLTTLMESERQALFVKLSEEEMQGYVSVAESLDPDFDENYATQWSEQDAWYRGVVARLMAVGRGNPRVFAHTLPFFSVVDIWAGPNPQEAATIGMAQADWDQCKSIWNDTSGAAWYWTEVDLVDDDWPKGY